LRGVARLRGCLYLELPAALCLEEANAVVTAIILRERE
jgi:hypothetical protein